MDAVVAGDDQHAALASRVRRQVLNMLLAADHPLGAATIAQRIGLHVTTVRFHLDQLENAKLIRRRVDRVGHRGRPPVVYVADPSAHAREANHRLAEVLVAALATDEDGGRERGIHAGEAWGRSLSGSVTGTDDPSERLIRVLDGVGFEPTAEDATGAIRLKSCPFRDIATEHPQVVCSVHLGLMQGALATAGRAADDVSLDPFVEPELCVARLHESGA